MAASALLLNRTGYLVPFFTQGGAYIDGFQSGGPATSIQQIANPQAAQGITNCAVVEGESLDSLDQPLDTMERAVQAVEDSDSLSGKYCYFPRDLGLNTYGGDVSCLQQFLSHEVSKLRGFR